MGAGASGHQSNRSALQPGYLRSGTLTRIGEIAAETLARHTNLSGAEITHLRASEFGYAKKL
jgi:hypothetical protein